MQRIGATIAGFEFQLLQQLSEVSAAATTSAYRLATGNRVNSPKDDPSAFLQISGFEQDLSGVKNAVDRVKTASTQASQLQLNLDLVRTQLDTIRDALIADEDQGLSADQRAANQASINDAIKEINRLAGTETNGKRLLDGSADYRLSGVNRSQIRDTTVYATPAASVTLSGSVTSAGSQGTLTYTGAGGEITADATFTLTGKTGLNTFDVVTGNTLTEVADLVNQYSHRTGITATVAGDDLDFTSVDFGTDATVKVETSSGTFNVTGTGQGTDGVAVINGKTLTGNGNKYTLGQNGTHAVVEFEAGFTGTFDTVTVTDEDVQKFALSPDTSRLSTLSIGSFVATRLGGLSGRLDQLSSGGAFSGLATNTSQAIRIVDEALGKLTVTEGRIDGFADATVGSSEKLLEGLQVNLEQAIGNLNNIDEDEETLLLAKNQALASNIISGLALVNHQRANVAGLLRLLAGI